MHTVVPAKSLVIGIIAVVISILLLSNVSGNDLEDRNDPPLTPCIPDGPTTGYSDIEYEYSSAAIDPDGDDLYYMWDWGDNSTPVWYGPYYSGQTSNISHEWTELGTYQVRVKAKDNNNVESDWSESLNVSIIGQTLYVGGSGPGNYSNIQDAIDDATSGDTVYVYNGTYYEHVIVDKSINLIGENRNSTTINAGWNGDPVRINADWVNISEFKIKNSGDIGYEAGVYTTSNNNNISHNIILRCYNGIFLKWDFYNNTVFENTIINNGIGIYLCGPTSKILKNTISSNMNFGIKLTSGNNLISSNDISDNLVGISFYSTCNNNIISNNTFNSNIGGVGGMFIKGTNHHILNNKFSNCGMVIIFGELNNVNNNIVNNKPVIYLENESDLIIDSNTGQIIIINCENITINNQTLSNTTVGIELFKSNNCTIFNNSISNNSYFLSWGILLLCSNNTMVYNNSIKNTYEAIYLEKTNGNIIRENTVSECSDVGIYLNRDDINTIIEDNIIFSCNEAIEFYDSSNNTIRYNNIINNEEGIWVRSSSNNNKFYLNNLINSSLYQAKDEGNNEWFDEFTSLGNYWDDYNGTDDDGDGIGDIPYTFCCDNQDNYPLMNPIMDPPVFVWVDDDFNSSTPGWQYDHFDSIQDGIDAVAENGTVYVYNGTYVENVVVNKTINLTGEDRDGTIIDGAGIDVVVKVMADSVHISNFNIMHCGPDSGPGDDSGIFLCSNLSLVKYCTFQENELAILIGFSHSQNRILNCSLLDNYLGIWLHGSHHTVSNNLISQTGNMGIMIDLTNNCIVDNNDVKNNAIGTRFYNSYNNSFHDNNVSNNWYAGLQVHHSSHHNEIFQNIFENNEIGIDVFLNAYNNLFYHNSFINNNQTANDNVSNTWDNGYPSGGNYWDDYYGNDVDGDGIGDTPYNISGGNNQDLYPLGIFNQPPVADFTYSPILPNQGETIQFNATAIDYDGTIVNYTWYFGYHIIYGQNPTYQFNLSGIYPIVLEVRDDNDGTDTVAKSIPVSFDMMHITNASVSWNFISTPYNQQLDSYEFIYKYDGYYYDWGLAITDVNPTGAPLINSIMFGWNRTQQTYVFESNLDPGYGCWMYAYQPVEIWIQEDTAPVDENITDLEQGWNIVGVPYNENVSKDDILVDDTNWDTAVGNGWISDFVFGWDRSGQSYNFANTFMPGYCYWMYAYQPCTLKRVV